MFRDYPDTFIKRCMITLFFLLVFFPASKSFADVVFIANKTLPENQLTPDEIKNIFLGDMVTWKDGRSVVIVICNESEAHREFTTKYTNKTPSQFISYWRMQLFSGKAQIPKTFADEKDVVNFVENTPCAIGYISSATTGNVKIITIAGDLGVREK